MNVPVMVTRRGDATAGVVLLKINRLGDGCMVLSPSTSLESGARIWLRGTGPDWVDESTADEFIERQARFDTDLWVLEIEDREGRAFVEEKIE